MTSQGPKPGNRQRNTVVNNYSKRPQPVVGPSAAVSYGSEMGSLQQSLFEKLAALRMQKGLIQGQFTQDKALVRSDRVAGAVGAESDALSRGIVGSSADLGARSANVAASKTALAGALQTKTAGLLGLRTERITAANEFQTGMFDIIARKQAEKAEMANQAFLEDLVLRQGDEQSAAMEAFIARIKAARAAQAQGGGGGKRGANPYYYQPHPSGGGVGDERGAGHYGGRT